VGLDAKLLADAMETGDGGKVVIWSDIATRFYGAISARGGTSAGNGGFVEVSGKQHLDFQGTADTLAPKGKSGTLLLDPDSITITTTADDLMASEGVPPFKFIPDSPDSASMLTWATIQNALKGGTVDVTYSERDISIANSFNFQTANTATGILNLNSAKSITATTRANCYR